MAVILFIIAVVLIPYQEIELLTFTPAYQSTERTVEVDNGQHFLDLYVTIRGSDAISAGSLLKMYVYAYSDPYLVSALNVTEIAVSPEQGLENPLVGSDFSDGFLNPAVVYAPIVKGTVDQFGGESDVVYYTSGDFNGTLTLFGGNHEILFSYPLNDIIQVGGEDVTFGYVDGLVTISLTIVLVAFVLLEFRRVKVNRGKRKQTEIDDYLAKQSESLKNKLRGIFGEAGKDNRSQRKEKEKRAQANQPTISDDPEKSG